MPPKTSKRKRVEEEEEIEADDDKSNDGNDRKKKAVTKKAAPKAKKAAKATKSKTKVDKKKKSKKKDSKKSASATSSTPSGESKERKPKQLRKYERLEEARKAYKWWEAPDLPDGINWRTLEHPAINFPPEYIPHNIPILYDNKPVKLNSEQEEIASFYAAMPLDGPQLGNPKTKTVFQKNFFEDFTASLGAGHVIKKFEKCNFDDIRRHLDYQKSLKKTASDEEKQTKKIEKETLLLKYGYALIDGRIEKMGNFTMEPPGLFRGRGEHPKTGKLKSRCHSENVHLNLSEDACVPICGIPGHSWGSVRHDPNVTWLCSWNENVQNQIKYVMLSASSTFKGKSDQDKYSKAIMLKGCIHKVRSDYTKKIKQDSDLAERQLGVAMWVIDVLALRVGGEKGEDEADTVGCCSLRVEHLTFNPDKSTYEIELEFLGKDSMLYKQNINFAGHGELGKTVYECLKSFCRKKSPGDDVFDTLQPPTLNKHLSSLMKGLTAKVFRTFNASVTLEKELPSAEDLEGLSIPDKIVQYNAANRQVAILCNHQKTVSKAAETMFENLNEKLATLKEQRRELEQWKALAEKKKAAQIPLKKEDKEVVEEIKARIEASTKRRDSAKNSEDKLAAAAEIETAKTELKADQKRRFVDKHKFASVPANAAAIEARISKWTEDIRKMEIDIRNRDENKEVALGTSKINYMDPRISVAWCKRCEVPIDKVFAKTLRDKFNWAMAVPPDWKFE
eukprot:gene22918-31222_t